MDRFRARAADKPLAFANLGEEETPALGRCGLRLCQEKPELIDSQLEALALAARDTGADVKVMAPMVATAEEAAWFASRVRAAGLPAAGVMIEVPAAALRSRHVLAEVDFGSLGTNDLAQYTMAADRMEGAPSDLLDPWQPAVLDMVAAACAGGAETGKPVGMCGESAGDPYLALALAGLGVASLSMAPSKVPAVKLALSLHSLEECSALAQLARAATSAIAARDAVRAVANSELSAILSPQSFLARHRRSRHSPRGVTGGAFSFPVSTRPAHYTCTANAAARSCNSATWSSRASSTSKPSYQVLGGRRALREHSKSSQMSVPTVLPFLPAFPARLAL